MARFHFALAISQGHWLKIEFSVFLEKGLDALSLELDNATGAVAFEGGNHFADSDTLLDSSVLRRQRRSVIIKRELEELAHRVDPTVLATRMRPFLVLGSTGL